MEITEDHLSSLVGSKKYRTETIKETLEGRQTRLQAIALEYRTEAQLLEIEGPTFQTVLDLHQFNEDSHERIREEVDDVIASELKKHIKQKFK